MNRGIKSGWWICITCVLGLAGNLFAQEDHLIENQRDVLIINDTTWGDTYVGQQTSGNGLFLVDHPDVIDTNDLTLTSGAAYVGALPSSSNNTVMVSLRNSSWDIQDKLQIGATNNAGNTVTVQDGGIIKLGEGLSIIDSANGNTFTLGTDGTLDVKSDFNASMDGFVYGTNNTLKVGGELSGLDSVESNRTVNLIGPNASWNVAGDLLTIGGLSDSNHVSFESGANVSVNNLTVGSFTTMANELVISTGARAHILDSLTIEGAGNSLRLTNGGWLEVEMDFDATIAGFELQEGGGLEAHRNLVMDGITNGSHVVLDGENALWDRSGLSLNIGSSTNYENNSLVIENGALALADQLNLGSFSGNNMLTVTNNGNLQINQLIVGETNTQNNTVLIADGGNLVLEGFGSYINATNSLSLINGGRLTVKEDFESALGWDDDAGFFWGNGGILEVQGEAPIFSEYTINGQYTEFGTLFLRDGQILMLNGSNAAWNAAAHNLHVGDLSSGNALIVTNGANADVKSMTIGDFKEGGHNNLVLITGEDSAMHSLGDIEMGGRLLAGEWSDGGSNNVIRIENGGTLSSDGAFRVGGYNNTLTMDGASSLSTAGDILFTGNSQRLELSNGASLTNGGTFSMTGEDSSVLVKGAGSLLTAPGDMTLAGSNLLIGVINGGTMASGGEFSMASQSGTIFVDGSNSLLSAASDMTLVGSNLKIDVSNGASLTNGGTFSMTGDDSSVIVNGAGSLLATAGDFYLTGSNNIAGVLDGGQLSIGGSYAITGGNSWTMLSGTNSTVNVGGDVSLGGSWEGSSWTDGGGNALLWITEGANLQAGGTLRNSSGSSGIMLEHGAVIDAANYNQATGAFLNYDVGNIPTNLGILRVAETAELEVGAKLGLLGEVGNLRLGTTYTNTLISAETLIVGTHTNATSKDLALLDTSGSTLMKFLLYVEDQDIRAILNRIRLAESAGYAPGSMMWDISNEIDKMSLSGSAIAGQQIKILGRMSGSEQHQQLNQLYAYQLPTFMHNQGIFGGLDQVRARGASFHGAPSKANSPAKPAGAAGPHAADQGLQGWVKVYGSYGDRDRDNGDGFEDGYDVNAYGTIIGLDQSFGDWLFGLAGGYAESDLEGDNDDKSDATTGYGILYASYGTKDWFGDLVGSYGQIDMDNKSGTDFNVKSDVDASQTTFYMGGGYKFEDEPTGVQLRPLAGIQIGYFDQDGYTEKSSNAVAKDVDSYDRWSYQSILGASMVFPKAFTRVDLETHLRTYWLHEYNDDEDRIGYTLIDSAQTGRFSMRSPDQDIGQVGLGLVAKYRNGLQLRTDVDGQFSETFSAVTVSGALLYEF